jgi:hypothetical protein
MPELSMMMKLWASPRTVDGRNSRFYGRCYIAGADGFATISQSGQILFAMLLTA